MAAQQGRQWPGVTPPISLNLPTNSELTANDALIAELKRQNNFEGIEETERRYDMLLVKLSCTHTDILSSGKQLCSRYRRLP